MKTKLLISILALLCLTCPVQAKDVGVDIVNASAGPGMVAAGAVEVTFLFSSTFTGTVAGATFAGATDTVPIKITSGGQANKLAAIQYTVTAGSVRIIRVQ